MSTQIVPFQQLYQHIKKDDPRLFEALDRISGNLSSLSSDINTNINTNKSGRLYKNVRDDFGAVGDNVTDNYSNIQNAYNWAAANGAVLYFPSGTYFSSKQLQISQMIGPAFLQHGVSIRGSGYCQTILNIRPSAPVNSGMLIDSGGISNGFNLSDMSVIGNNNVKYSLRGNNLVQSTFKNVACGGCDPASGAAAYFYGGVACHLDNFIIDPNHAGGTGWPTGAYTCDGLILDGAGSGAGANAWAIDCLTIQSVTRDALSILNGSANNHIRTAQISVCGRSLVIGGMLAGGFQNTFKDCLFEAAYGSPDITYIQGDANTFEDCTWAPLNASNSFVTAGSWVGGIATLTINGIFSVSGNHGYTTNSLIQVSFVNPAGYNTTGFVHTTSVTAHTVSYAVAVNPGTWISGGEVLSCDNIHIVAPSRQNYFGPGCFLGDSVLIDSGDVHLNELDNCSLITTNPRIVDGSKSTIYRGFYNYSQSAPFVNFPSDQISLPRFPNTGSDQTAIFQGTWQTLNVAGSPVPTQISPTQYVVGKAWKAVFIGDWCAANLYASPGIVVLTDTNNSITMFGFGSAITFDVNAQGFFEMVGASATVGFSGMIIFIPRSGSATGSSVSVAKQQPDILVDGLSFNHLFGTPVTFANLSTSVDGVIRYCSDCNAAVNAGGGPGFFVIHESGIWRSIPTSALVGGLLAANNLSDVSNAATSRTNLGLGSGLNVTITTDKLTVGGSNGSMTFVNGILTASIPAN